jgi:hypothetical protein
MNLLIQRFQPCRDTVKKIFNTQLIVFNKVHLMKVATNAEAKISSKY